MRRAPLNFSDSLASHRLSGLVRNREGEGQEGDHAKTAFTKDHTVHRRGVCGPDWAQKLGPAGRIRFC